MGINGLLVGGGMGGRCMRCMRYGRKGRQCVMYEVWADRWAEGAGKGGGVRVGFVYKKCIYTKVGHPREGTRQTVREGRNVVWVKASGEGF